MENMRKGLELAEAARHPWQKRLYFLLAVEAYLEALEGLWKGLLGHPPRSPGLQAYRAYLEAYRGSPDFLRLRADRRGPAPPWTASGTSFTSTRAAWP
jgi:hypothetical protein